MGTKHPDRINPTDWRDGAETVGRMYEKRWELTARCDACDLVMLVDLRVVIRMKGPAFSLWNQRTRCRRIVFNGRCRGFVAFEFKAPGMTQPKRLSAPDRAPDLPRRPKGHVWRAFEEERARQLDEIRAQAEGANPVRD